MKDQQEEDKNPMEMNLFLDQVLKTVLKHGGDLTITTRPTPPGQHHPTITTASKKPAGADFLRFPAGFRIILD